MNNIREKFFLSAKFPYRRATKKFIFNIFNISGRIYHIQISDHRIDDCFLVRVGVISLLAAYLKIVTVAFIGVNTIALFILASLTMRTYFKKNLFTSFAGLEYMNDLISLFCL